MSPVSFSEPYLGPTDAPLPAAVHGFISKPNPAGLYYCRIYFLPLQNNRHSNIIISSQSLLCHARVIHAEVRFIKSHACVEETILQYSIIKTVA
jgi:hypothetical protein